MSGHKIYCADCVTKGTGRHEKEVNIPARCSVDILQLFFFHGGTKDFSFAVIYRYARSRTYGYRNLRRNFRHQSGALLWILLWLPGLLSTRGIFQRMLSLQSSNTFDYHTNERLTHCLESLASHASKCWLLARYEQRLTTVIVKLRMRAVMHVIYQLIFFLRYCIHLQP